MKQNGWRWRPRLGRRICFVFSGLMLLPFFLSAQQIPFSLPLSRLEITSPYGYRIHPVTGERTHHSGVDFAARSNPVFSVLSGKISETGNHFALGKYVRISHGRLESLYGHLSHVLVDSGQIISAGQLIGVTGRSGRVTGEHLHFSVILDGQPLNPLRLLEALQEQSHQILTHE